jgi:orotidine-5'-phosphate decarboxylase
MSKAHSSSRVIVALDYPDATLAMEFVDRIRPADCRLKIGKELFMRTGSPLVELLVKSGFDVFLDLKFHDIPTTVGKACAAAADLGVWMMNVHALGGVRMLESARTAIDVAGSKAKLIAVTILTSMNESDLQGVGLAGTPGENVERLAGLASETGLDGVVCSAQEAARLRSLIGENFLLITPGVRPAGSSADDQRRIMTPADAVRSGASYLVIGRPVTRSDDPARTLLTINSELNALH